MRTARIPSAVAPLLVGIALMGAVPNRLAHAGAPIAGGIEVVGDTIPRSLTGTPGDVARGRDLAFARDRANCPVCHVIPSAEEGQHGDVGPSLAGVADRLSEGQMRLMLVDMRRLHPTSIMPSYHRVDGLRRVATVYAGMPVLTAQEVEDVLAFLMTLHEAKR